MRIEVINQRVDKALEENRRTERVVIRMAVGIFVVGISIVMVGYFKVNPYLTGIGSASQLLLYWPIRQVLKLRRDNLILQILPVLTSSLPSDQAAEEIRKLLDYLRQS